MFYDWLVFVHIVGVLGFVFAHGVAAAMALRLRNERNPDRIRALLDVSSSSLGVLYAAILLLLVGGVWAGFEGDWWDEGWIWVALGTFVANLLFMYAYAATYYKRVREVMTAKPITIEAAALVGEAARMMKERDIGDVIVMNDGAMCGVVTDRDICMAVATNYRPAAQIAVREVSTGRLFTCKLDDDVKRALDVMRTETVRRLPVVDTEGKLQGIISLNDLALAARPEGRSRNNGVAYGDLVSTMQAISH